MNRSLLGFPKCQTKGEPCELWPDLVAPIHAIFWAIVWAVVVGLVVYLAFKLAGWAGAWTVVEIGSGFWALLWIVVLLLGLHGGDFAAVAVPVVAYGLAGAVVRGRPSRSAHGEATGKSP